MRFTLFSFLVSLLTSFSAHGQLNGAYIRDGEVYNFHSDGSFDWIKTESDISYGNGSYKINGKKLELAFAKARLQFDIQINESKQGTGNKSIVEVRIMYANGQPIQHVKFTLVQSGISQYLNDQGILALEISSPTIEDKFVVDVNGRTSSAVKINLKGNDTILGIVVDETTKYKENTTETVMFKQKRGKIALNKKIFNKS